MSGAFAPTTSQFGDAFEHARYLDCLKNDISVLAVYFARRNITYIRFADADGIDQDCAFEFDGNVLALNDGQRRTYPITPGGSGGVGGAFGTLAAADPVQGFDHGRIDDTGDFVPIWSARNLPPVTGAEMISILTDSLNSYARFIGLFDDDTTVTGSSLDDQLESGAGNDRVVARGGDDLIVKWRPGDLSVNGGAGIDTLDFSPQFSVFSSGPIPTHTLLVDLLNGTGRTQFGGDLALVSIERIVTIENRADTVFGSNGGDTVFGGFAAGDRYVLRGGDDAAVISVFQGGDGITVDGGAGVDRLSISEIVGPSVLDLSDQAASSGVFAESRFTNVEVFDLSARSGLGGTTEVIGTAGAETILFRSFPLFPGNPIGAALLTLGNGADSAQGGTGNDTIYGGAGDDTLAGSTIATTAPDRDRAVGGSGNDSIDGGAGNDALYGGTGRDTVEGGTGDDQLFGGENGDVFRFDEIAGPDREDTGVDRIMDFGPGDRFDFRGHARVDAFGDLVIVQNGTTAVIRIDAENRILVRDTDADDIGPGLFLF